MGGDAANAAKAYQCSLNRFDDLLAHCGVKLPRAGRTSILSIPASIAAGSGDRIAEVRGPLNTASTLSEILLLEYAEGMPFKDVGWGCVDGVKVREFIDLHTAASELFLRPPAVAAPQARELLRVISASLEQAAGDAPFSLESVARYAVGDYLQPGVLAGQLLERTRTSKWRMVPSFFWMLLRNGIKYVSSRRNLTRFVSPPLSPPPR